MHNCSLHSGNPRFAVLRRPGRVWAIGAVHGDARRLAGLHAALARRVAPHDRLVYLGNVLGRGRSIPDCLDELLAFRCAFLARPMAFAADVAMLRGGQEEMWQKLFELHFAIGPLDVLNWMVDQGLGATIEAYGGQVRDGLSAARQGPMAITRWTNALRAQFQRHDGHRDYLSALRRAAYADDGSLLFVSAGLDPERPLDTQKDAFWWSARKFEAIDRPYGGFRRIVRGLDPDHRGVVATDHTLSLDSGCGFGGSLAAACLTPDGRVAEVIEV
ncbi:MAG: hypothetical protein FJX67_05105 [Alphaproteobacteria bacterium]|nr:hypothetical protein [Alphaproteobacteria bacterium]